jgi:predicted ester cyclase
VPGPEILKDQTTDARAKNPGLRLVIEDIVESDGKVWARMRGSAHLLGKRLSFGVIDICRFQNGKMVEYWGSPDRLAILHKICALAPPK